MVRRLIAATALLAVPAASAAQAPDIRAIQAEQRQALATFAKLDGVWRGPAWSITPAGRHEITQTERIGPFLDGTVRVIEGRGYNADGSVGFNALGVISYDPAAKHYTFTSWALGHSGAFDFKPTADGYQWETPAGPGAVIRYTATINGDRFREVGERIAGTIPPVQVFEMNLRRVGDTSWPAGNPVPMK